MNFRHDQPCAEIDNTVGLCAGKNYKNEIEKRRAKILKFDQHLIFFNAVALLDLHQFHHAFAW